jgi:Mannosyl-glycoprotein endo-beta-N-acetylglucosaminidase
MTTGTVTAIALKLRDAPDGDQLDNDAMLSRGDQVEIKLDDGSGWLLVVATVNGQRRLGFVDGVGVKVDGQPPPSDIPAPARGFTAEVIDAARVSETKWKIPACVSLAQWAQESAFGKAMPAGSQNPFGIKAVGDQDFVLARTRELEGGHYVYVMQKFRKFPSLDDAFDAHGRLLATGEPYARAMAMLPDFDKFCEALTGVYATDPHYGDELIKLINTYNLASYDVNL